MSVDRLFLSSAIVENDKSLSNAFLQLQMIIFSETLLPLKPSFSTRALADFCRER